MARMTGNAAHIEVGRDLVHQVRILINDGDVVLFARQATGNPVTHTARPAYQNLHRLSLSTASTVLTSEIRIYA